jgi:starvation-inducible DNA-binding protein
MDIKTGISTDARQATAEALKTVLADSYATYAKAHVFHWNVRGPHFQSLHTLFMTQYNELWLALDLIAERIRALGSLTPGLGALARQTSIAEAAEDVKADAMIAELLAAHTHLIKTLRAALAPAEAANDQATIDLLTQRLNASEKHAWMLRATLGEV